MISSLEGVTKDNSANFQSRIQCEGQYNLTSASDTVPRPYNSFTAIYVFSNSDVLFAIGVWIQKRQA